jgi:adenylate kinase
VIPGARLIILGRQGAGKGTQCTRLSRHYVVPHISTGDILRAAVREGTEMGKQAAAILTSGSLVSDEIMIGIVADRLERADAVTRGYLLDGFPRTVPQAKALGEITSDSERPIDVVIDLDVPRELVLDRLTRRRVCNVCQTNYVASGMERQPWICDNCGGDVVHRDDDTPEAINHRLDLYESQTSPLIEHYQDLDTLSVVNGVGHPDDVFRRIVDVIERFRRRRMG